MVSVPLNTIVHFVLQADRDPERSHTNRVLETKVNLDVNDMRHHSENTWERLEKTERKKFGEFSEEFWIPLKRSF